MMSAPRLALSERANYKWWAFMAIAVGIFTTVVDFGSVNVALPTIAAHFGTDLPTIQWVVIGYALTISALLMPMGRLSDIIGRKQVYIAGFLIFILSATLAGFSTNTLILILFRVIQGVGAAMTQGISMAMIVSAFPGNERGKALGLNMSVVGTGGIAGPAMGGFLVSALGWRWVFFVNIPLGLLSVVAALLILDGRKSAEDASSAAFDWLGAVLSTAALVTLLITATAGSRIGWGSPVILVAIPSIVGLFGAFVWWELRCPAPMLDLRLFKHRVFSLGITASFISFLGMSSVRFLMPFYLQGVLGYSPGKVGLIMVPNALSMIATGPLSGRLSDRFGWRKFNVGGLALSTAGLLLLSTLTVDSSLGLAMSGMILQSLGIGMFQAPNNSSILSTVERNKYGVVSGFVNLIRNSANVTSVAIVTAIVTATMVSKGYPANLVAVSGAGGAGVFRAFASGLRIAYLAMGGLVVLGIVASFLKGSQLREMPAEHVKEREIRSQTSV